MGFKNNFRAGSLITKDHRLILCKGADWGELYDFTADPHELFFGTNLKPEINAIISPNSSPAK